MFVDLLFNKSNQVEFDLNAVTMPWLCAMALFPVTYTYYVDPPALNSVCGSTGDILSSLLFYCIRICIYFSVTFMCTYVNNYY